jgi:hypothetical protein
MAILGIGSYEASATQRLALSVATCTIFPVRAEIISQQDNTSQKSELSDSKCEAKEHSEASKAQPTALRGHPSAIALQLK